MTREHIYGGWLKHHLRASANYTHHWTNLQIKDSETADIDIFIEKGRLTRPGTIHGQHLKLVCRECNETWMSVLQNDAKPFVLSLIEGRWPFVDTVSIETMAKWVAMVSISLDYTNPKLQTTTQQERATLWEKNQPPDSFLIFAGFSHGQTQPGAFWHRAALLTREKRPKTISDKTNFRTTTFCLARSFFHVVSGDTEFVPHADSYAAKLGISKLWPFPTVIPSAPLSLDIAGINRVATALWRDFGDSTVGAVDWPA